MRVAVVGPAGSPKAEVERAYQGVRSAVAAPEVRDALLAQVLQAWVHFHNGEFQEASQVGLAAGGAGITAANKATSIYANYLEKKEKTRLELFTQVAEQAQQQAQADPKNANAWYWHAYALGRYSQGISVAKALAQGLGSKIRESLEKAIALAPAHADAHIALGAFHAEVIDKVGALVGGADQCVLGQQIGGGHEVRALGDEVGLAAQRDEHAGLPPVGHPGDDQAVRGLSLGSLGQRGQPLLTENLHRPIDVAGRFLQGFLAIHHALAGSVAKFHDGRS